LNTRARAFGHADLDADGVAWLEFGELAFCFDFRGLFGLELTDDIHRWHLLRSCCDSQSADYACSLGRFGIADRKNRYRQGDGPSSLMVSGRHARCKCGPIHQIQELVTIERDFSP